MKKVRFLTIVLASLSIGLFGQELALPPELNWWLSEVRRINVSISVSDFKLSSTNEFPYLNEQIDTNRLYPVFYRWNFYGDKFAYYDLGTVLKQDPDGRYKVSRDIDSRLGIINRKNNMLFADSFGSSKGLNGVAWLRDNALVAVGIWMRYVNDDKTMVDLVVREYRMEADKVIVSEYLYKDAFNAWEISSLHLEWWEHRMEYFSGRW